MTNEPTLHEQSRQIALSDDDLPQQRDALIALVKQAAHKQLPNSDTFVVDLVRNALDYEINWTEIITAMRDDEV